MQNVVSLISLAAIKGHNFQSGMQGRKELILKHILD
jgi:hypothetical protein